MQEIVVDRTEHKIIGIGKIGNYYGCLSVVQLTNGKCYWSIEDWEGHNWEEIPQSLYNELIKFENQCCEAPELLTCKE